MPDETSLPGAPAPEKLSLSDAVREANARHGAGLTYSRLWTAVVACRVPAERGGTRYRIRRDDLGLIARTLGPARPANAA
jgi:hypothetical protein